MPLATIPSMLKTALSRYLDRQRQEYIAHRNETKWRAIRICYRLGWVPAKSVADSLHGAWAVFRKPAAEDDSLEHLLSECSYALIEKQLGDADWKHLTDPKRQMLIEAWIGLLKLERAESALLDEIKSHHENSQSAPAFYKNITHLAALSKTPNRECDRYVREQFERIGSASSASMEDATYVQELFSFNDYLLKIGQVEQSRKLFENNCIEDVVEKRPEKVGRWIRNICPASYGVDYFGKVLARYGSQHRLVSAYVDALISANQIVAAREVLGQQPKPTLRMDCQLVQVNVLLGEREAAFELACSVLRRNPDNQPIWNTLIGLDSGQHYRNAWVLFEQYSNRIVKHKRSKIFCQIAKHLPDVCVDWDRLRRGYQESLDWREAHSLLALAVVKGERVIAREIIESVLARLPNSEKFKINEIMGPILNLTYKWGLSEPAASFIGKINGFDDDPLSQMYVYCGVRRSLDALVARNAAIAKGFLTAYRRNIVTKSIVTRRVAIPEKDLAGQIFMSCFYAAEYQKHGRFSVICDRRLRQIYSDNFHQIEFIPREPRPRTAGNNPAFNGVPLVLSPFLDRHALDACETAEFFTLPVADYFHQPAQAKNRTLGWLRPDAKLVKHWQEQLGRFSGAKLIGISATSAVSAPIRDIHTVPIQSWGGIFELPDVVFVNLNANFRQETWDGMATARDAAMFWPEFDLYNDFDNLLALMSCLDYGILPANNLMEFASAAGLRTFILNPSGIMRNWLLPETGRYLMSDQVQFIFPDFEGQPGVELVAKLCMELAYERRAPATGDGKQSLRRD